MDWTHLKPGDGRRMPWKNGGGSTLELAVDPPGATLETGFAWRLSTAEVAVSGPFSAFPGLERMLLLLEGAGFAIDFGPRGSVDLTQPLRPIWFSGDWPATATLVDGPCMDFNLMVDPRKCRTSLEVLRLTTPRAFELGQGTTLLSLARGTLCIPALELHLGQRHTLRLAGAEGALDLVPGYGGAALIAIRLDRV